MRELRIVVRLEGWSLSKDDWQVLTDVLANVEWRKTWLNELYQDSVPPSAGIYLLVADEQNLTHKYRLPNGLSSVLYVGKSDCLRDRFKQHATDSQKLDSQKNPLLSACRKAFGDLRYLFAVVPETAKSDQDNWLKVVENALTTVLSPPANRNVPQGPQVTARLGPPQPVG